MTSNAIVVQSPVSRQESPDNPSLKLHLYTLALPNGHWLKEVTANAAAIAPLLKMGWVVVSEKAVGK